MKTNQHNEWDSLILRFRCTSTEYKRVTHLVRMYQCLQGCRHHRLFIIVIAVRHPHGFEALYTVFNCNITNGLNKQVCLWLTQGLTQQRSPKPPRKAYTTLPSTHTGHIPVTAPDGSPSSPRPSSARILRSVTSGGQGGLNEVTRSQSAGRHQQQATEIPTAREGGGRVQSPLLPPAPAPSEPGDSGVHPALVPQ